MRTLRRALSATAILLVVAPFLAARPAAADNQEAIKLTAPSSKTVEYGPLEGADPFNQPGFTRDPGQCATLSHCDNIPIELSVPQDLKNSDTEDYFLRLKIEWDNSGGDNVNTYLYDSPWEGDSPIASSATANMPETINLYRPEKAAYILLVHNNTGVNTGYKVTAAITVEPFGGAPDFGGVSEGGGPATTRPPADDSDDSGFDDDDDFEPPSTTPVDPGFGPPPPLANIDQDASLSALARGRGDFEDSLTAPVLTREDEEGPPPKPVSGATVALLGGLLPAAIVGGGVFWLRRTGGTASAGF